MAYIRRLSDGAYVDRNGTAIGRKQLNRLTPEQAIAGAAALTAAGTPCRAHDSAGGFLQSTEAPAATDETIDWTGIPWRITPVKLPNGKYLYSFRDRYSGTIHNLIDNSPMDVVRRLQIQHPQYLKHIETLMGAPQAAQLVEPAQPAPAAQLSVPGRILRPGSNFMTELPERRPEPSAPSVNAEAYADFYKSASVVQLKEAMKNPDFLKWMNESEAIR